MSTALTRLRLRTPEAHEYRSWSISLHLCIGLVFTTVILLLGAVLISYSYSRHKELAMATAADLFDHISQQTAGNIGELYAPVEVLVDLTSSLPLVSTGTSENLDNLLGYFAGSLRSTPQLSAIFVGFSDGDFYLMRSILGYPLTGAKLGAPANTELIVQHIQRNENLAEQYSTHYYDTELNELNNSSDFVTGFDPRTRSWYNRAMRTKDSIATDFYRFYTTLETGVTIAQQVKAGNAVVGADMTLHDISGKLSQESLTADTEVIVFSENGTVLGYRNERLLEQKTLKSGRQVLRAPHINDLDRPVLDEVFNAFVSGSTDTSLLITAGDEKWFGSVKPVVFGPQDSTSVFMAIFVPEKELLSDLQNVRLQSVAISLVMLSAVLALAWWISKRLANLTRKLALEADKIRRLNFDPQKPSRSRIREIDGLSISINEMRSAIRRFADLGLAITGEQELGGLAEAVVTETCNACNARYGGLWLVSSDLSSLNLIHEQDRETRSESDNSQPRVDGTLNTQLETGLKSLSLKDSDPNVLHAEIHAVSERCSIIIDDTSSNGRFAVTTEQLESMMLVPLITAEGRVVGLLQLGDRNYQSQAPSINFDADALAHVEALASNITVAVENHQLMKSHHDTFESLIQVMAVATDAKSAHTGGHCQRVPVLTGMLAEAASISNNPAFRKFKLTPAVHRELHVASWLHDCGKVTTPEHVADKATKLETIYNRIHEIRTRFEVILRDIHIRYYKTLTEQADTDAARLRAQMKAEIAELHEDFAFIAECNIGSESMTPEQQDRVRTIAKRGWVRHFDNTIGLSMRERNLQDHAPSDSMPIHESLLADKIEHTVPRKNADRPWGDNPYGFNMDVPEHEYNHGEIYNLTIEKGTLTAEERFKINDHIVQTQIMLNSIPFPRELQRVPSIAGNHHEKLDGSGFPRGLNGRHLGIEERMMVIADIFEALTAADRPYKKAKSLSESINIMNNMVEQGLICADLFDLFLESRVYEQYAINHLRESQIDTLDFHAYTRAGKRMKNNVA